MLALFFLFSTVGITPSKADDVISVGHGDHIVVTLRNDGLIDIDYTILMTSNKTVKGTFNLIQSLDGVLVGEPNITADSRIESCELLWKVEGEVTVFNVTIKTDVEPFKFRDVTISYTLNGSLKFQDGSWYFERVFSSTAGSLAPPEIVVKVPKPSEFDDLSFEEMIPIPHVFLEEGLCYTLVWKSEAFLVGNTSVTLVRLKYSVRTNWLRIVYRYGPPMGFTFALGYVIKPIWELFMKKRKKSSEMK